jgi:hypothetical protein
MNDCFLLQKEFEKWLNLQKEMLCFKPIFYTIQLNKFHNLPIFNEAEGNVSAVLENEIICDNSIGVENIILKYLGKLEENGIENALKITRKEVEGVQIGLLKYRLFLHHFISERSSNHKKSASPNFSEIKQLKLAEFINDNSVYILPIYQDIYVHNKVEVEDLWRKISTINPVEKNKYNIAPTKANCEIATILLKKRNEKHLEVIDGGNTLIMLSILLHVLSEFSSEGKNNQIMEFLQKINLETKLNEQQLFRILVNNGINRRATTPNKISKGIVYNYEESGLNSGHHFLQTAFHFVQLLQVSSIPQSKNHIADIDVFTANLLQTNFIKIKILSPENNTKTYMTTNAILIENLMEWL